MDQAQTVRCLGQCGWGLFPNVVANLSVEGAGNLSGDPIRWEIVVHLQLLKKLESADLHFPCLTHTFARQSNYARAKRTRDGVKTPAQTMVFFFSYKKKRNPLNTTLN